MGGAAELPRAQARLPQLVERGPAAGGVARVRPRRRRPQHLRPWRGGRGGGARGRPSQRERGAAAAVGCAQPRPRRPRAAWLYRLARTLATPPHSRQRATVSGGGAACVTLTGSKGKKVPRCPVKCTRRLPTETRRRGPPLSLMEHAPEVVFRERLDATATMSITPAAAVMPLGAAMTSLLAAPEVEFALAIGSSEPDADSATVKALRSIEAHLRGGLTSTTVWSLVEPLIDQSVGKKRGGRRHTRAAAVLCWQLEHAELGAMTADVVAGCLGGPPDQNRLKLAAAGLLQAAFASVRTSVPPEVAACLLRALCACAASGGAQPTRLALGAADAAVGLLAWACRAPRGCAPGGAASRCLVEARALCACLARWRVGQWVYAAAMAELVACLPPASEAAAGEAALSDAAAAPAAPPAAPPAAVRLWGACAPLLDSDVSLVPPAEALRRVRRWLRAARDEPGPSATGGGGGGGGGEGGEGEGGRACSIGVSCQPVMVPEPCSWSKVEIAPSSIAQYLVRYCGGRFNALATSVALTITVFLPLPRPSSLPVIGGIL